MRDEWTLLKELARSRSSSQGLTLSVAPNTAVAPGPAQIRELATVAEALKLSRQNPRVEQAWQNHELLQREAAMRTELRAGEDYFSGI